MRSTEARKIEEEMMRFAKLMDAQGRQIEKPDSVPGSVSWDAASGRAHAWAEDGKTLLAEMSNARVVWMAAAGIRLEGVEPVDRAGTQVRAMAWQLIY